MVMLAVGRILILTHTKNGPQAYYVHWYGGYRWDTCGSTGRRSRGENQGRWWGDAQRGEGGKEENGGDKDDGGTGERETELDGGITGKQQRSRGKVPCGGD